MNSYSKYPEPFTDGIHSNIEIGLSFMDRLRVLFGANIFVDHDTLTEHGPGRVQSTTRVHVRRLTSRAGGIAAGSVSPVLSPSDNSSVSEVDSPALR